ncbi:MAG: pirin family protein [Jatrophihabitans sp.]
MTEIRPATARLRTDQPGITTWHAFSAGPHYDPGNIAFGPIVGCDEHLLEPSAGFDWHGHRGVVIVSWVLAGTLRHEDSTGKVRLVPPGVALVQSTGDGIRHAETNASGRDPLHFVQTTVLSEAPPSVVSAQPPLLVGGTRVDAGGAGAVAARSHVFVTRGEFSLDGGDLVRPGDTVRVGDDRAVLDGAGELLVITPDVLLSKA